MKKQTNSDFPEERQVKCVNCDTKIKIIARPEEDMSNFICPKCSGEDLGEQAEW